MSGSLPFVAVGLLVVGAVLVPAAILGLDSDVLLEAEFTGSPGSPSGTTRTVGSVELDPGDYEVWMEEAPTFFIFRLADYDVAVVDAGGTPVRTAPVKDDTRKIQGVESERRSVISIDTPGVYEVQVTEVMDVNLTGSMWVFIITPRTTAYYASLWGGVVLLISGVVLLAYVGARKAAKNLEEERARRAREAPPPPPVAPAYAPYPQYPPYQAYAPYQPYPQSPPPPPPPYPQPPPPYPPPPQQQRPPPPYP